MSRRNRRIASGSHRTAWVVSDVSHRRTACRTSPVPGSVSTCACHGEHAVTPGGLGRARCPHTNTAADPYRARSTCTSSDMSTRPAARHRRHRPGSGSWSPARRKPVTRNRSTWERITRRGKLIPRRVSRPSRDVEDDADRNAAGDSPRNAAFSAPRRGWRASRTSRDARRRADGVGMGCPSLLTRTPPHGVVWVCWSGATRRGPARSRPQRPRRSSEATRGGPWTVTTPSAWPSRRR